jgi:hypothetical protein
MPIDLDAELDRAIAALDEIIPICRNIIADMAELERVDPQAHAALIEVMNNTGEVR